MQTQLAIKRLTASDLTFFEWHFRNRNAGNQKAINLNANVFIDELFPNLPDIAAKSGGRIPLDLYLYGPGIGFPEQNLQRKVVKFGTYKNWRLNGEFIADSIDHPDRYHVLAPDDLAVIEFAGDARPESARIVFLTAEGSGDRKLFEILSGSVRKMAALTRASLEQAVDAAEVDETHPIHVLLASERLREAAQSGEAPLEEAVERGPRRLVTREELRQAKESAEITGEEGEALINNWLALEKMEGRINDYLWSSQQNAVSPYDFEVVTHQTIHVDVKATSGDFGRPFHISAAELRHLSSSDLPYVIYRVYRLRDGEIPLLRISDPACELGKKIIAALNFLPEGVKSDGVVIDPSALAFGKTIELTTEFDSSE